MGMVKANPFNMCMMFFVILQDLFTVENTVVVVYGQGDQFERKQIFSC